jgi:hypothetical protein
MSEPVTESEPTRAALAEKVGAAEEAIRGYVHDHPGQTPGEVQTGARNGWSPSVMAIAFWSLVNQRVLRVDDALRVQAED